MKAINKLLTIIGFRIIKYPDIILKRRMELLKTFQIDLIFDVGASTGQYAKFLRNLNYKGKIISFEPIRECYMKLEKNARNDPQWTVCNYALGDFEGEMLLNIANNNGQSSSFLSMKNTHLIAKPNTFYTGRESVKVKMLNSVINNFYCEGNNLFIKLDVQGFEKQVLNGASHSFDRITGFQIELSLSELYENSALYIEIIQFLNYKGYELFSIEPGLSEKTSGRLLQFDGIFFRV